MRFYYRFYNWPTRAACYFTGGSPYPGIHPVDIYEYLCSGKRMKAPVYCPSEMYVVNSVEQIEANRISVRYYMLHIVNGSL